MPDADLNQPLFASSMTSQAGTFRIGRLGFRVRNAKAPKAKMERRSHGFSPTTMEWWPNQRIKNLGLFSQRTAVGTRPGNKK